MGEWGEIESSRGCRELKGLLKVTGSAMRAGRVENDRAYHAWVVIAADEDGKFVVVRVH